MGLSLGSSAIKLVELQKSGSSWKLVHFGIVQLAEDVIVGREIINPVAVSESIKTLVNQLKLKTKNVCSSISGTSVIIKRMQLEVQNSKELQDSVFWEAEQYLPFDISEVFMDFQVLSQPKDKTTDVMLVAAKKTTVDSYMSCIEDSGLKPKILDTDFFALQTAFEANYSPSNAEAIALVDIGAASTKIAVIYNGVPVFTKDSSLGGRNLTAEIQKQLNLSYSDAEALKVGGIGGNIPQEVSDLMRVMGENFSTEIKRALDFYNASSSGAPVSQILLAGGSAKIEGLAQQIEDGVGLPTQIVNPFNSISYDPQVFTADYLAQIAPLAAVPLGLALRSAG